MTPSEQAKAAGLKSLQHAADISHVSPHTLINWHRNKKRLFDVVLCGCRNIVFARDYMSIDEYEQWLIRHDIATDKNARAALVGKYSEIIKIIENR